MYTNLAIAALASVAAALPAPQAGSSASDPLRFTGVAFATGKPIQFASVNAHGGEFLLLANTTTYQPPNVPGTFNNDTTVFTYVNGAGTLGLSTSVPGGQQAYITEGDANIKQAAGQLRFTSAHSTDTSGPADYTGFSIVYDAQFQFEGQDWIACPSTKVDEAYEVYASSRTETADPRCYGFTFHVNQVNSTVPSAWQYE